MIAGRAGGDARARAPDPRARVGDRTRGGCSARREPRPRRRAQAPAPLRPQGRPALRLRLGVHQVDARRRRRCGRLLPRGDARGGRGPTLHRQPHGHPRVRGRRQRRPDALVVAVAAAQALEHVGLPEAQLNLAQAAIYLARAPEVERVRRRDLGSATRRARARQRATAGDAALHGPQGAAPRRAVTARATSIRTMTPPVRGLYLPEELEGRRYYRPSGQRERSRRMTIGDG